MEQIYIVTMNHEDETGHEVLVLGVYDNYEQALTRVNEVYGEQEDYYIDSYGYHDGHNHHNGYAELHLNDKWDETIISMASYNINQDTNVEI